MDSTHPREADREFDGHDFRDADLSGLRTERVVYTECDFTGADLSVNGGQYM